jgi:sorting and assembly machinery component 37
VLSNHADTLAGRLPSLHDRRTRTWTASFPSIITHLSRNPPPTFHSPDAHLTPFLRAKSTAYAAHLAASAAPLLSLSLYASTANWTAAVRPAYSSALPFPLGWTEVSPLRRSWLALADATGIDLLDAEDAERPPQPADDGAVGAGVPKDLRLPSSRNKGIRDLLTPEQKARIRLHAMVDRAMDVLQDLKGEGGNQKWLLTDGEGEGGPTSLDCLAFGYLALMVYPDLPRPWLRDRIVDKYPGLQGFVNDMTAVCFGDGLPTTSTEAEKGHGFVSVAGRFVDGALRNVPGLGEEWRRWRDVGLGFGDVVALAGGSMVAAVLVAAYVLHRRGMTLLPILGAPVHRWEAPRRGLAGFGAAGALFGGLFAPEVRFGGVSGLGAESGSVQTELQAPFGGMVDGVEVDVNVDID